jgi:hypothetical protein
MDRLELRRDAAADELSRAFASGVLDEQSFEGALQAVQEAPSVAAIDTALARVLPRSDAQTSAPADPGQSVSAILGQRSLTGNWIAHRSVEATCVLGDLTLDLRDLVLSRDTRLHVVAIMGEVTIRVPPSMAVDESITTILAEHTNRAGNSPASQTPRLTITGFALMAEVKITR